MTEHDSDQAFADRLTAAANKRRLKRREGRPMTPPRAGLKQKNAWREGIYQGEPITLTWEYDGLRRREPLDCTGRPWIGSRQPLEVTHAVKRVRDRTSTSELRTRLVIGDLKAARSRRPS
jgi:hypothetical protein